MSLRASAGTQACPHWGVASPPKEPHLTETVRVLLVIASPLHSKTLEQMLASAPGIEVVGVARHGREALAQLNLARPHLVCTDDQLPMMNGLELTREIMRAQPCPVVVLCQSPSAELHLSATEAGALEVLARPVAKDGAAFVARLKMLSRVPVIGRRARVGDAHPWVQLSSVPAPIAAPASGASGLFQSQKRSPSGGLEEGARPASNRIIAIGASTGGPGVLMAILGCLPAHFPVPVLCVQHVSKGFLDGLVSWLDEGCRVRVRLARDGEIAPPATVLLPPEDVHLEVGAGGRIRLSSAPPRDGHRPSVSTLFESVARSYGSCATAVLLTGMGADGASGLLRVRQAGGDTFAQEEASCVVFGMPRVAIECGAAKHICAPEEIARRLSGLG